MTRLTNKFHKVVNLLKKPELLFLPGQLAFSLVFSIVPALSLISAFAAKFHFSLDFLYSIIGEAFSIRTADNIVNMFATQKLTLSNIFILIVALYIASSAFSSIIIASDSMYGLEPTPLIKRRVKSFFLILLFFTLVVFILLVPVFGNLIIGLISKLSFVSNTFITSLAAVFNMLKWPITLILIIIFIKLIYTFSPNKLIPSSVLNKGSIFTSLAFFVVTMIYSFYVNNIATYDLYYGNFSNVIILMFWLYLMSYILVVGIAINEHDYKRYLREEKKK